MKKTLSLLAVLGIVSVIGTQSAHAFSWSSLNPAYWGHCPKCEKKKSDCDCNKKCDPCEKLSQPCPTGAAAPCDTCEKQKPCDPCAKKKPCAPCQKAAPCNPCQKQVQQQPCSPCDKLQQMNK